MPRDPARPDLYARVTDAIVADLEAGVRPWTRPWTADGRSGPVSRPLRVGGQPYSGVNVAQIDGLPAAFQTETPTAPSAERRNARAHDYFAATGAQVRYGGGEAYYAPGSDHIQMPVEESFPDIVDFYATQAHESVHWTRHPTRLNRDLGRKRWGDEGYAREELVAELGAAFLCADLGLELRPRRDHADYIGDWLQVLKNDKRFVFSAAAYAQKACDHLWSLQPAG